MEWRINFTGRKTSVRHIRKGNTHIDDGSSELVMLGKGKGTLKAQGALSFLLCLSCLLCLLASTRGCDSEIDLCQKYQIQKHLFSVPNTLRPSNCSISSPLLHQIILTPKFKIIRDVSEDFMVPVYLYVYYRITFFKEKSYCFQICSQPKF